MLLRRLHIRQKSWKSKRVRREGVRRYARNEFCELTWYTWQRQYPCARTPTEDTLKGDVKAYSSVSGDSLGSLRCSTLKIGVESTERQWSRRQRSRRRHYENTVKMSDYRDTRPCTGSANKGAIQIMMDWLTFVLPVVSDQPNASCLIKYTPEGTSQRNPGLAVVHTNSLPSHQVISN